MALFRIRLEFVALIALLLLSAAFFEDRRAVAQTAPEMTDPRLGVRVHASGLNVPTTMAFIGPNDILVLEKNTGIVRRVTNGIPGPAVLDLAVNNFSERGLLGIALHPNFPSNPSVYLYWTESSAGADTNVPSQTFLLGNRVDRFTWNGTTLTLAQPIIDLRAIQDDAGQPERGNHNGGVLAFGPGGKLLIFVGDVGRRGWLQNLPCGPTPTCPGPTVPDDQFGGPAPDDAHLTGVVLRLNEDGSTPTDNPFFAAGAAMGGQAGANIQKIFSYGHRNGFGMAVDLTGGGLWLQENGDDSFSELSRVDAGENGGWIQIAGPSSRIAEFKQIETTFGGQALQQIRWPPTNVANSEAEALSRLYMLPGAQYDDPDFSWKWEVAPGGLGFAGSALGSEFAGDIFMGAATDQLEGGYLFRFNLTSGRNGIAVSDPRLNDLVADNVAKHEITESESLLIGRNFGVVTDVETGPNGNLFVVSLSEGTIYEIFRARADVSVAKAISDTTPEPDQVVTYRIRFRNLGPDAAGNVVMNDQLPAGYVFEGWVGGTPAGCNNPAIGTVAPLLTCTRASMVPGTSQLVTFMARIPMVPDPRPFNVATVSSGTFDPRLSNNTGVEQATLP